MPSRFEKIPGASNFHNRKVVNAIDIEVYDFLVNWYGDPEENSVTLPAEVEILPEPLKDWHRFYRQWGMKIMSVSHMITPESPEGAPDKTMFMQDSTGDYFWSFNTFNVNEVYEGSPWDGWRLIPENMGEFIARVALNEAMFNAKAWRMSPGVSCDQLMEILTPLSEVNFGDWNWPAPGFRMYMTENLLAHVAPGRRNDPATGERKEWAYVQVSSNNVANLSYLDKIVGIEWLRSSI